MQKLSATIITFNEEENIERCVNSVRELADEILVVDSYSTDRTVELAKSLGARVVQNPFEGFIQQRRFCIENATHDFILAMDCDECIDENLKNEILKIKEKPACKAYFLNRLSAVGKRFVYYGNWHPDWKIRLFFREAIVPAGNPPHDSIEPKSGIKTKKLKGKLLHYSDRNRADRMKAIERHSTVAASFLYSKNTKSNYFRLVVKPAFRFFSGFILKKGFLDGELGFFIARSEARYVFLREKKLWHLWRQKKPTHYE